MYIAIAQYGQTYHIKKHPRNTLLNLFGRKHASKMYRDKKDGTAQHVGYVIAGFWLSVYKLEPAFDF